MLIFAGKVRAGMTPRIRAQLFDLLKPLRVEKCPFSNRPNSKSSHWGTGVTAEEMKEMVWVRPKTVVQIRFVQWTAEANLRHAAFVAYATTSEPPPSDARHDLRRAVTGESEVNPAFGLATCGLRNRYS